MLLPRKTKYRKQMRGKLNGKATRGNKISYGEFGLISLQSGWITARQIEAARRAISHFTKRGGKIWITIFPDKPISKKPPEVRMGGGKGDTSEWVAAIKPGRVMFEIAGVAPEIAKEALRLASHKMPVKTKIAGRGEF